MERLLHMLQVAAPGQPASLQQCRWILLPDILGDMKHGAERQGFMPVPILILPR